MEPSAVLSTASRQPVPVEPLRWLDDAADPISQDFETHPQVDYIGRVRVPIAGPYRPWARLYRLPDLRLVWTVRLWDRTRAVRRVTSTPVLLEFARVNRLPTLASRVRSLDLRGRSDA
ncbi:MAG: hypothetical protein WCB18_07075 [Thermoplasmata archaeon]